MPLLVPLPVVSRGGVVAASAVMLVLSGGAVPALLGLGAVQSAVVVLGSSGVSVVDVLDVNWVVMGSVCLVSSSGGGGASWWADMSPSASCVLTSASAVVIVPLTSSDAVAFLVSA